MQALFHKLVNNPVFYIFLAFTLIFLPSTAYLQPESDRRAVVVAVGLDKKEQDLEISLLIISPKGTSSQSSRKVVSGSGKNVTLALDELGLNLGRVVGLAHCEAIVVSDEILSEDIVSYLDFFIRTNNLTTNALMVNTSNSKELLEASANTDQLLSYSLRDIIEFNDQYLFTANKNLENFYRDYYTEGSISFMPIVDVKKNEAGSSGSSSGGSGSNEGSSNSSSSNSSSTNSPTQSSSGGTSGSSSGESSGSSTSESGSKQINNNGNYAILKKGKKILEIEKSTGNIFNILSSNVVRDTFVVSNNPTKETILETVRKFIFSDYSFFDGVPIVNFSISLLLKVNEIKTSNYDEDIINTVKTHIDKETIEGVKKIVLEQFAYMVNISKSENLDLFSVEKELSRHKPKEWNKFNGSLDSDENFLEKVIYCCDIIVTSKA